MSNQRCIQQAWDAHEVELRSWLLRHLNLDEDLADEFLQNVFFKAIRQGKKFCEVEKARAWLFATARNAIIDYYRVRKIQVPVPENLPDLQETPRAIDSLASCLPRALSDLGEQDADILRQCDIEGVSQVAYAKEHGLSIPGAKSRLQRARRRLRIHLTEKCQVRHDDEGTICCFVPCPPVGDSDA